MLKVCWGKNKNKKQKSRMCSDNVFTVVNLLSSSSCQNTRPQAAETAFGRKGMNGQCLFLTKYKDFICQFACAMGLISPNHVGPFVQCHRYFHTPCSTKVMGKAVFINYCLPYSP